MSSYERLDAQGLDTMLERISEVMAERHFILDNQTLSFNNLVATVSDSRITSNSKVAIYYSNSSLAMARSCSIEADSEDGLVRFTVNRAPTSTITCSLVIDN